MLKEYNLQGKVAIVTGAARGIGRGIALTMAEAGADIVAADIAEEYNEQTAAEIRKLGRQCLPITIDVTKAGQVQEMVNEAISRFGKIDILVNNAGKGNRRVFVPLDEQDISPMSDEDWEAVMNLNVKAVLNCVRAVGPHMIERRGGKIIIISSATAIASYDYNSLYCISKAAVARLTQTLAREWAPYNINVNAIGPSWTLTEGAKQMLEQKGENYFKKEMSKIPLGRAATPRFEKATNMSYAAAFEKASREIASKNPAEMAQNSGAAYENGQFTIQFLNRNFTIRYPQIKISEPGADAEPPVWLQLTLLHYLINASGALPATFHCPSENLRSDEWIVYRQLPGVLSAGGVFQRTVINPVAQAFGEDVEGFKQACTSLGGRYLPKSGDAAFTFLVLPRLPMAIVLYLGEEGMLPSVNVLFDATASAYLPSEDLILIGEYLSAALLQQKGLKSPSSAYLF